MEKTIEATKARLRQIEADIERVQGYIDVETSDFLLAQHECRLDQLSRQQLHHAGVLAVLTRPFEMAEAA